MKRAALLILASTLLPASQCKKEEEDDPSIPPPPTVLASVHSSGAQGDAHSLFAEISSNGRYVVFQSAASTLVAGDTNGVSDIFVRDLALGITVRVSVDSAEAEANGASLVPSISADGRYVAFQSVATNLVAGDANADPDIFVRDTQSGTTARVSIDSAAGEANGGSFTPSISSDGRHVAFASGATNLVTGDVNGHIDIFVRDTVGAATTRASVDSLEAEADAASLLPAISGDGTFVAFQSPASTLVAGDTNAISDIFVRDLAAGTTARVSVDSAEAQAGDASTAPSISSDGRFVAFESPATDLVAGDTNAFSDIFLRDTVAGTTIRVSVDSSGVQGNAASIGASISADGGAVAFQSQAANLIGGHDTNGYADIFVRRLAAGVTIRVSVDSLTRQTINGDSRAPSISGNGLLVAFESQAASLVMDDLNGADDVFVHGPLQ